MPPPKPASVPPAAALAEPPTAVRDSPPPRPADTPRGPAAARPFSSPPPPASQTDAALPGTPHGSPACIPGAVPHPQKARPTSDATLQQRNKPFSLGNSFGPHPTKKQRAALHPSKIKPFSEKGGSGRNRTADTVFTIFATLQDIGPASFYEGETRRCAPVAFPVAMLLYLEYPSE